MRVVRRSAFFLPSAAARFDFLSRRLHGGSYRSSSSSHPASDDVIGSRKLPTRYLKTARANKYKIIRREKDDRVVTNRRYETEMETEDGQPSSRRKEINHE